MQSSRRCACAFIQFMGALGLHSEIAVVSQTRVARCWQAVVALGCTSSGKLMLRSCISGKASRACIAAIGVARRIVS